MSYIFSTQHVTGIGKLSIHIFDKQYFSCYKLTDIILSFIVVSIKISHVFKLMRKFVFVKTQVNNIHTRYLHFNVLLINVDIKQLYILYLNVKECFEQKM